MGRRILVADDEADLRLLIRLSLEEAGWEVIAAEGGAEALAVAGSERLDAVLLDAMMPGLDGQETCRRLRQDPTLASVPIIFLSAAAGQLGEEKLRELGARGAIAKPFDVDELPIRLEALLSRTEGAPRHPAPVAEHAVEAEKVSSGGPAQEILASVRRSVLERNAAIETLFRQLEDGREELRRAAHSLAGKAPMVDLPAVGEAAAALESAIETDRRWGELRAAADALLVALEQAPLLGARPPMVMARPTTVGQPGDLIAVDDDAELLRLIQAAFAEVGWQVRTASDEESLLALLEQRLPDGITLDVDMPGLNGFELCARLRQRPEIRDVPVLFLTSRSHADDVASGLALGSDDYLIKTIPLPELVTRVTARVGRAKSLLHDAHYDALTGLPNRRSMEEDLVSLAAEHDRTGDEMAVAVIDLDHFKEVNDLYGHVSGDAVLRTIAQRLVANMRRTDHCGRWGGEEFLVVLPHTPLPIACQAIERLHRIVGAEPIDAAVGLRLERTFSAGVAGGVPVGGDPGPIVESADAACYEAKRRGRNQVVCAGGE